MYYIRRIIQKQFCYMRAIRRLKSCQSWVTAAWSNYETVNKDTYLGDIILTNIGVWYGQRHSEIEELEAVDRILKRKMLSLPNEAMFLETGCVNISTIVKCRRLNFFHATEIPCWVNLFKLCSCFQLRMTGRDRQCRTRLTSRLKKTWISFNQSRKSISRFWLKNKEKSFDWITAMIKEKSLFIEKPVISLVENAR